MSDQPLVTIGIPTRNRAGLLAEALQSALNQTYENIEIIVSDNASSDETPKYLKSITDPRVKTLRHEEMLPMAANWNTCLRASLGEYFVLLSDDDLLEPSGIEELVRTQEEALRHGLVAITYGQVESFGDGVQYSPHFPMPPQRETLVDLVGNFLLGKRPTYACCLLIHVTDKVKASGYPEKYDLLHDASFWIDAAATAGGSAAFTPRVVARYRVHAESASNLAILKTWAHEHLRLVNDAVSSVHELRDGLWHDRIVRQRLKDECDILRGATFPLSKLPVLLARASEVHAPFTVRMRESLRLVIPLGARKTFATRFARLLLRMPTLKRDV